MELLFFDREDDAKPARIVQIDSAANRTYHYWHVFVLGAQPEQIYGYRAHGPRSIPRTACDLILPRSSSTRMVCSASNRENPASPDKIAIAAPDSVGMLAFHTRLPMCRSRRSAFRFPAYGFLLLTIAKRAYIF
jgi:hypothetical protein